MASYNQRTQFLITSQTNAALSKLIARSSTNVAAASARATNGGTRGAMNLVRILNQGLAQQIGDPADLLKVHSAVAANMRESVKSSFEGTVKSRTGVYRVGQNRISGGALKRAITSPQLAQGTAQGIDYVDQHRLDQEAVHWRRLNFGALGTAVTNRPATSYPFRFDDITLYSVGFSDASRPAFSMPPGLFLPSDAATALKSGAVPFDASRRGLDRFYPGSKGNNQGVTGVTRGIRPRNFLDAGLKRMVRDLPLAYETMIEGWLDDASKRVQLPPKINVRAGLGRGSGGGITQSNP